MENTNVQEVKMPITYDDLKKSLVDSGRPYDFAMIDRAYALAEKAHGEQRRRSGARPASPQNPLLHSSITSRP